MSFPSRKAAVVGVYTSQQARALPRTAWSLEVECVKGALEDAGLSHRDVDGLIPMAFDTPLSLHMRWAEQLGGRPISFIDIGSGAGAAAKAALGVASGMANVVVAYFANAGYRLGPQGSAGQPGAPRVGDMSYMIQGAYMSPWYAMWTRRYMHQYGVRPEQLAEYAVIARHHATLNPASVMGPRGEITVDDVFSSRMISDPLHLLECPLDNDGGYAFVIASEAVARTCRKAPVWILGGAEAAYTDPYQTITPDWISDEGAAVRRTADLAFGMAGVSREDIDTAGLYDCFPVTVARDLEEMSFCKVGEGAEYIAAGHLRLGGRMPANTDGGLLSHSHNGNPSGFQVIEVARQLRGECGPRQVRGARIGAALSQGWAVHGLASTVIMAAD
ncbi:thiolase family protein [Phenylobacterium sp.]|jgi:acetyl-CoA acetyltransferase|uniref:thiolase family protein n=1 Tax=Phenylobacterium sp. TaxID=1871053 RepID=UPI002F42A0EA